MTVKQLLTSASRRFADKVALVHDGRSYTYGELADRANQLGHLLLDLGVGPGQPVAMLLPNGPDYVIADQAIARIGAARVALTEMLSPKEIAHCLTDSGATVAIAGASMFDAAAAAGSDDLRAIVTVDDAAQRSEVAIPSGVTVVALDAAVEQLPTTVPDSDPTEDDLGLIIYTGGTTGKPKGVMHLQRQLALNLCSHVIETGMQDDERLLLMSPLPHSAGFLLQTAFLRGATVFLEQKFDPELVVQRIADDRVTYTFMVPTMIYRVLDAVEGRTLDLGSLRTILYGAAPITVDRLRQGLEIFGPVFMQLYAQSEAPNFITRLRREDHSTDPDVVHRLSSCGQAVALAEVRIVGDDGEDVAVGEIGEVAALTPYTMVGYNNRPDATATTLRNGWLFTGDIGRLDADGYLYLLDRKNDMIISGGMNVYTSEVEGAIVDVPGVQQVAVVGVPHPDWGEAVIAYVVADEHDAGIVDRVIAACRTDLAKYKVPKQVHVVAELPTTVFGKIDKKALRNAST
ncbi:AMP-binding protein [Ilumatobacter coccineus]|nr:AMP-binding protein [Ilumatobacter coccineus]